MFFFTKILSYSCEIRTKVVRNSYELYIASIFTHIHSCEIRTKFVRNLYKFRANFTRFSRNLGA